MKNHIPYKMLLACIVASLFASKVWAADHISGHACYHYSDNESLIAARDVALSLAKRDALESYIVFVQASSTLDNFQIKNDIVATITAGYLSGLKIRQATEDLQKREVCRSIDADVDPVAVKSQIRATVNASKFSTGNAPTGLPENLSLRVVKIEKRICEDTVSKIACIFVSALCKEGIKAAHIFGPRVTWLDPSGAPEKTYDDDFRSHEERVYFSTTYSGYPVSGYDDRRKGCSAAGDVIRYSYRFPPKGYTFKVTLPN